MPLPEKEYFSLEEVEERWDMQRRDTAYYAENGLLEISTRVRRVMIETGFYEVESGGQWFTVPDDQRVCCGLLPLREHDLSEIFLYGMAAVHYLRCEKERYARIIQPDNGLTVNVNALVVSRDERDRVEREHGLTPEASARDPATDRSACYAINGIDFTRFELDGVSMRLGPMQAEAARILHEAAMAGSPWMHGKDVLRLVGAQSMRIVDLFKTQKHWRELIESDGRGHYRLSSAALEASPSGHAS